MPEISTDPLVGLMRRDKWADRVGVSVRTTKRWERDGLPVSRVGQQIFVRIDEARDWLIKNGHV